MIDKEINELVSRKMLAILRQVDRKIALLRIEMMGTAKEEIIEYPCMAKSVINISSQQCEAELAKPALDAENIRDRCSNEVYEQVLKMRHEKEKILDSHEVNSETRKADLINSIVALLQARNMTWDDYLRQEGITDAPLGGMKVAKLYEEFKKIASKKPYQTEDFNSIDDIRIPAFEEKLPFTDTTELIEAKPEPEPKIENIRPGIIKALAIKKGVIEDTREDWNKYMKEIKKMYNVKSILNLTEDQKQEIVDILNEIREE